MSLNTITFEGNLTETPELTHTPNTGTAVVDVVVLVNSRTRDADEQWVDDEPTRYRVKAWKRLAENLAQLPKGATVLVHGTVTTDRWNDATSGQRRTENIITAAAIGASLRFSAPTVNAGRGDDR